MTLTIVLGAGLLLLILGFPMFMVLMIPAVLVKIIFYPTLPDLVLVQKMVGGMNHSVLLAIPFFIFAAELMGRGVIARQLTAMLAALFRRRAGGIRRVLPALVRYAGRAVRGQRADSQRAVCGGDGGRGCLGVS